MAHRTQEAKRLHRDGARKWSEENKKRAAKLLKWEAQTRPRSRTAAAGPSSWGPWHDPRPGAVRRALPTREGTRERGWGGPRGLGARKTAKKESVRLVGASLQEYRGVQVTRASTRLRCGTKRRPLQGNKKHHAT